MKKRYIIAIITLVLILTFISPIYYRLRSYIVMFPYSYGVKLQSSITNENIKLYIPGGRITNKKDWYPFVLYHNGDRGFSKYSGKDLSLTILYNFGYFENTDGSSYYNPNSPYYSSFYGGYVVYNNENPDKAFGFNNDGSINYDELSLIPKYDQSKLVMPSLGYSSSRVTFKNEITSIKEDIKYIGIDGWTKIDANIKTNSPLHKYAKNQRGYIQYGKPSNRYYSGEDFPIIDFKGRIYAKYIDKYKMTVVFYILAPDKKTIEECDNNILSKSKIEAKE